MSPYVRTVKTASGARAVQIVHSSRRGSRDIEHIGSAHDDAGLELLYAVARQRLAAGQDELDLGLSAGSARRADGAPLPITSSRMGHLWDALAHAYRVLGFDHSAGGDEVFRQLVLARIIEPTSKLDTVRVLEEIGIEPASYPTINRRLAVYAEPVWRAKLAKACAARAGLGPASLVLYDVSTLYFETDAGDGFREPGFSKERRLEPQITIGLLTDAAGFPLMVNAFEGNAAETTTMLPTIRAFINAHRLPDVTVVADAGMVSAVNQQAIEDAGLSFILGARIPEVPYVVNAWRRAHPDTEIPDAHVFTQPWPAGPTDHHRDKVIYYQYRAERARNGKAASRNGTHGTTTARAAASGTQLHAEREELRHRARRLYSESLRNGRPLTGAEVAQACGMSDRWGRQRIAETRRESETAPRLAPLPPATN